MVGVRAAASSTPAPIQTIPASDRYRNVSPSASRPKSRAWLLASVTQSTPRSYSTSVAGPVPEVGTNVRGGPSDASAGTDPNPSRDQASSLTRGTTTNSQWRPGANSSDLTLSRTIFDFTRVRHLTSSRPGVSNQSRQGVQAIAMSRADQNVDWRPSESGSSGGPSLRAIRPDNPE